MIITFVPKIKNIKSYCQFKMKKTALILIFIFPLQTKAEVPWKSGLSNPEDLVFELVTIGPGNDVLSWFGHAGLVIKDTTNHVSRIYNFGMTEDEPAYLLKFLFGCLEYFVDETLDSTYIREKIASDRDVFIQTLNIPLENRLDLSINLSRAAFLGNTHSNYDNYFNNCSTKLRDILNSTLNGKLYKTTNKKARMTLRAHTKRFLKHLPYFEILLIYLLNDSIDKPTTKWEEMFLPSELEKNLANFKYKNSNAKFHKLVVNQQIYYKSSHKQIPEIDSAQWQFFLFTGFILGFFSLFLAFFFKTQKYSLLNFAYGYYTIILGTILGFSSLLLVIMSLFGSYEITFFNENLLIANPLTLIFLFIGIKIYQNKSIAWRWLTWNWSFHLIMLISAACLKLNTIFDQDNGLVFALTTPLYVLNAISAWVIIKRLKLSWKLVLFQNKPDGQ